MEDYFCPDCSRRTKPLERSPKTIGCKVAGNMLAQVTPGGRVAGPRLSGKKDANHKGLCEGKQPLGALGAEDRRRAALSWWARYSVRTCLEVKAHWRLAAPGF